MPPLVWISAAWLLGLVVAHTLLVPFGVKAEALALLTLIPIVALLLWRRDRPLRLASACALVLLLACLRYQLAASQPDGPSDLAHYNGAGWVTVEGVVRAYPDVRDTYTGLVLDTTSIALQGRVLPVHGRLLVWAPRYPEYRYGDLLRVSGLLEAPPELEEFSYRDYLARRAIYTLLRHPRTLLLASDQGSRFTSALYGLRDRARLLVDRLLGEPEAALLQGILLGIRGGIPRSLFDDFNDTGTSHILVVSGANVSLVAAFLWRSFGRWIGKRRAYGLTMAGIVLYVLLVGAEAAALRAGLMACLVVTARHLGRHATAHVSLFAAAAALTVQSPLALWDPGFQLSFAATLGLLLFSTPIERFLEGLLLRFVASLRVRAVLRTLNDALSVTLAAQVLTLPIILVVFGRLSLLAPLANLLILPVQPAIMAGGGLAVLVGLLPLLEPLAQAIAWLPWLCLAYTVQVVQGLAAWPLASVAIGRSLAVWLVAGYGLFFAAVWLRRRRKGPAPAIRGRPAQHTRPGAALGLLLAFSLGWIGLLQLPDRRLHVAFLDVEEGDATLITTARGRQILIDGGPSPSRLTSALSREMPFWDRSLDLIVLTHADADHIAGLPEVLERYRVDGWLDSGLAADSAILDQCRSLLAEKGIPELRLRAGASLDLGEGITLRVLHPPADLPAGAENGNANSLVLWLGWGYASFLLTGDMDAAAESALLRAGVPLRASVLKVAHHGSNSSTTAAFLDAVDPQVAVISVGADNKSGHPAPELLQRLDQQGSLGLYRTDLHGTVELTTDGRSLWAQTEK